MLRLALLLIPTVIGAAGMGYVANDHMSGALIGGVSGFIIGVALNAFPNLNNTVEEDRTDLPTLDD